MEESDIKIKDTQELMNKHDSNFFKDLNDSFSFFYLKKMFDK